MAKRACGVPKLSTYLMSSGFKAASPRHRCQPTNSMGSPLCSTTLAASGSHQMLYSAAGVTFPSQHGAPAMITQAIAAMEPVRGLVRAMERFFRTRENGNIRAAKFGRVKRVARGLLNGDVSCNRGNRQHAHLGRTQGHDQSNGVVGSGVGINQEERFHAA